MTEAGRVALVTGATQGIGFEIARGLAEHGMRVVIGARDPASGQKAAEALCDQGLDAHYVIIDVTDRASVQAAAAVLADRFKRLDVLVNNAGISLDKHSLPSTADLDEMRRVYETNVFGVVAVIQAMLPLLRQSDRGRIVNMSTGLGSLALTRGPDGPMAFSRLLAYNSSKTALNAVTVQFANELAGTPIKINAANPGLCATELSGGKGQSPVAGAKVAISLALLDADGPTGGLFGEGGPVPW
ncbi:NAD(P)-dependent dehydrogenase (short-subunit alcohol dehydrogenase family) [Sphingobium sp. B1D7B]|uniref:SDR family oxidoreductase n=1 Tax=unclassified Sphingobium TaxID=2611147 RepID=UPI0022250D5E|nr:MULTISPECIES: SDR family oxidoreductase [unclassified Sphingobium]MCW2393035.1 NAD(P)-dependent dehydrogenase (short-subunit alcohol dehydrogenase family) [Sphingobium sp. B11D3A]MCW2404838.1 NAD(P)-dependent dehydrogenase (short-subunit alcohol dehydrogenase family) [Sphingobium sp. B1D7B]